MWEHRSDTATLDQNSPPDTMPIIQKTKSIGDTCYDYSTLYVLQSRGWLLLWLLLLLPFSTAATTIIQTLLSAWDYLSCQAVATGRPHFSLHPIALIR